MKLKLFHNSNVNFPYVIANIMSHDFLAHSRYYIKFINIYYVHILLTIILICPIVSIIQQSFKDTLEHKKIVQNR